MADAEEAKGVDALRRGDWQAARAAFSRAAEAGGGDRATLGLAVASLKLGDYEGAAEAADRALEKNPGSIEATIVKADALAGLGKPRLAAGFYAAAIRLAGGPDKGPPHLKGELSRAAKAMDEARAAFERRLDDAMAAAGLEDKAGHDRVRRALGALTGRAPLFPAKPTVFFLPDVPQQPFYRPEVMSWAEGLVARKDVIEQELRQALSEEAPFEPYMRGSPVAPQGSGHALLGNPDWGALRLYEQGTPSPAAIARFPKTLEALGDVPIPKLHGKSPNVLFSRLAPGAHIPPHHGQTNVRLICHLPLIVPDGCTLRVGAEERRVREGELLLFDDTVEHEARNASAQERIVLLFDVWRPELDEEEKRLVEALFSAVGGMA